MKFDDYTSQYQIVRPIYQAFTIKLESLLRELLKSEGVKFAVIEARTKDIESLAKKLNRADKPYLNPSEEITDLSAVRLILRSSNDIDKVVNIINKEFVVDPNRSVDKQSLLDPDRFGYLSQHFIVKINDTRKRLTEWSDFAELYAEIQVRTVLQHAWAMVSHSFAYKSNYDVPNELKRRLNRLSALFELADDELSSLIREAASLDKEYRKELEEIQKGKFYGRPTIPVNVDSLRVYLETSDVIRNWITFIHSIGVDVIMLMDMPISFQNNFLSAVAKMCRRVGIQWIKELDNLINGSKGWGEDYLREYFQNTF